MERRRTGFVRDPEVQPVPVSGGGAVADTMHPGNTARGAWRRDRGAIAWVVFAIAWVVWLWTIGTRFEVVAGGADSSGYLNSARLLAVGQLSAELRIPDAVREIARPNEFMPLGFTAGLRPGEAVPTYPPGLPVHFALAGWALGWDWGPLGVSVALAGAFPLLLIAAARELGLSLAWSLAGAVVLMLSPVTLFSALQPLSDLPAAVWCLFAWLAALRATRGTEAGCSRGARWRWSVACGAAVAMAVAVRPTSALLVPALLIVLGDWRRWLGAALGGLPGALLLAAYQDANYGHPLQSGYGNIFAALGSEWVGLSLRSYLEWLPRVLPPVVLFLPILGLAFPPDRVGRRRVVALAVWVVAMAGFYATYPVTHEVWWCLRFVLPAFPALVLAAALGGQAMVVRTGVAHRSRWSAVGAIGVAMWAGVLAWYWLPRLHLGAIGPAERVYREAGRWVAGNLPADAVVSSFATSGALYYYSPMATLRFDDLRPDMGPVLLRRLHAAGRPVFALVFDAERPQAEERLGGARWTAVRTWGGLQLWRLEPSA